MRRVRHALTALAGILAIPAATLAIGTFVPALPYLGTAGSYLFPTLAGPILVLALLGTIAALVAVRLGARSTGGILAVVGVLAAAGAATVIGRHARVAAANGADVNVFAALVPRAIDAGGPPDAGEVYTRVDGQDLHVDIYRPKNVGPGGAPVAVYMHGGGWIEGHRGAQAANLHWLASHGYLVLSPDYVLATPRRPTWNTAAAQLACSLAWAAAHAPAYGGDPGRLFAFGESAGGALALTTTYAAASGRARSSCGGQTPAVRAVAAQVPAVDPVTFYENRDPILGRFARQMVSQYLGGTPSEQRERARAVSSASYITPPAPPTLIVLAANDRLVPIAGALDFIDRARAAGVPLQVVSFPWADHGMALQYYSVANQAWLRLMAQHFCRYGGACGS
jgi:acetyl esterase